MPAVARGTNGQGAESGVTAREVIQKAICEPGSADLR